MTAYFTEVFKSYPIITKKPIRLCVEEVQIDDQYIDYDGSFEEFEHGEYEMCTIKAGAPLWVQFMPNGSPMIMQNEGGGMCIETGFKLGFDFDFDPAQPNLHPRILSDDEVKALKQSKPKRPAKPKGFGR